MNDRLVSGRPLDDDLGFEVSLRPRRLDEYVGQAQVIANLLTNAAKFTPSGGNVTVLAKPQSERVSIIVRDTGVGIAPEDQEAIFEIADTLDKNMETLNQLLFTSLDYAVLARRL